MSVLLLATEIDPTADHMVRALKDRECDAHRVDLGWFPGQLSITAELAGSTWTGYLRTPHRTVDLEEIHAVWYRSPTAFQFPDGMTAAHRDYCNVEAKFGLGGVLWSLPVTWINHPAHEATACYKPLQLATAARCGLTTPSTLVTNEAGAVRAFATGAKTVTKAFGTSAVTEDGVYRVAYTSPVNEDYLLDLAGVDLTAHQYQREVPKAYDARLVVVGGGQQFACAIHSGGLDFRTDYATNRYERIPVPRDVADGVAALMSQFRLVYAAIDFVVTPSGDWVFIGDMNPGGQYGFLVPIAEDVTAALADLLARKDWS